MLRRCVIKGIVIAGTHSGAGKTTITLGLMAALQRRGLKVAPFKVGPDFIDPGHHRAVTGRPSRTLDGWMLRRAYNDACFQRHAAQADVAVVEGVMGLFDGAAGDSEDGSTAQMAKWLGLPVLLVVSAASMARSAAALVQGFERFDPDLALAGILFNHLGSAGHLSYLKAAMDAYVRTPLLGGLVRDEQLQIPERHLGLVTSEEQPLTAVDVTRLADGIEAALDLDRLLARLPDAAPKAGAKPMRRNADHTVRLGVAKDRAFCFYYPDNLDLLAAAGAQIVPFSPLLDAALPEDLDGIYLGGGYPEVHAAQLAANRPMREAIKRCSRLEMPIYAECGGFMFLCRELADLDGQVHPMCGCFPFRARMHARLRTLGYREVELTGDTLLGGRGAVMRGHEFHYSALAEPVPAETIETVYLLRPRKGGAGRAEGYRTHHTLGSYVHLHFGSRPETAEAFVDACRAFKDAGKKCKK